jgi:hypothetical protein
METSLLLLLFFITANAQAQTICGTAGEGGVVTLTAPPGNIITSIDFASYGTPNGSCGSFTTSGCHAVNSIAICEAVFVGNNSASINATNAVFGDPCGGTVKRLYIQATYSSTLPLTLLSFSASADANGIRLKWSTAEEMNTAHFIIERSSDGYSFEQAGVIQAAGSGSHLYSFMDQAIATNSTFYRLKMVDADGATRFSNVLRMPGAASAVKLILFPNPSSTSITVSSPERESATITSIEGRELKRVTLERGSTTIDIASLRAGLYLLKTESTTLRFVKY